MVLPVQEQLAFLRLLGEEGNQQKLPAIASQQIDLTSRITHKKTVPDTREKVYPGGEDKLPPRTVQACHPLTGLVRGGDSLSFSAGFVSEDCFRPLPAGHGASQPASAVFPFEKSRSACFKQGDQNASV